ncbi:MAG: NAD(P)/FAD-dependent oxidoreductase [Marinicaulis sp.]|nr:NAD(P)/FAD-dependent oxidoreductase [Marinicaulis sp.]
MTERVDVVVIGAGVVGLAVARALALAGRDVIIVEKNDTIGEETSSRNSEVIHAGIQYKPGGVRASIAVRGRDLLYDYCRSHNVNHKRCGKLLVATNQVDVARLDALKANAELNGVDDLEIVDAETAKAMEPAVECNAAILSPSSGIVDSHGLMLALLGDAEDAGASLALSTPMTGGVVSRDDIELTFGGVEPMTLTTSLVVNCGGLWSDRVARSVEGIPGATIPQLKFARGQYFTYSGAAPFERLIYPLPRADSQGVHYTRDLGGQAKLGPDINFIDDNVDYTVDPSARSRFAEEAKTFWPSLDREKLVPGYAGIRPKTAGLGEEGDFVFSGPESHGVASYIGLYGIESPGLTTCLAIAEKVVELARE